MKMHRKKTISVKLKQKLSDTYDLIESALLRGVYQVSYVFFLVFASSATSRRKHKRAEFLAKKVKQNVQNHGPIGVAILVNILFLLFLGSLTYHRVSNGGGGDNPVVTLGEGFLTDDKPKGLPSGGSGISSVEITLEDLVNTPITPQINDSNSQISTITTFSPTSKFILPSLPGITGSTISESVSKIAQSDAQKSSGGTGTGTDTGEGKGQGGIGGNTDGTGSGYAGMPGVGPYGEGSLAGDYSHVKMERTHREPTLHVLVLYLDYKRKFTLLPFVKTYPANYTRSPLSEKQYQNTIETLKNNGCKVDVVLYNGWLNSKPSEYDRLHGQLQKAGINAPKATLRRWSYRETPHFLSTTAIDAVKKGKSHYDLTIIFVTPFDGVIGTTRVSNIPATIALPSSPEDWNKFLHSEKAGAVKTTYTKVAEQDVPEVVLAFWKNITRLLNTPVFLVYDPGMDRGHNEYLKAIQEEVTPLPKWEPSSVTHSVDMRITIHDPEFKELGFSFDKQVTLAALEGGAMIIPRFSDLDNQLKRVYLQKQQNEGKTVVPRVPVHHVEKRIYVRDVEIAEKKEAEATQAILEARRRSFENGGVGSIVINRQLVRLEKGGVLAWYPPTRQRIRKKDIKNHVTYEGSWSYDMKTDNITITFPDGKTQEFPWHSPILSDIEKEALIKREYQYDFSP